MMTRDGFTVRNVTDSFSFVFLLRPFVAFSCSSKSSPIYTVKPRFSESLIERNWMYF